MNNLALAGILTIVVAPKMDLKSSSPLDLTA